MMAGLPRIPDSDALARAAEAFVLVWSSMPTDLPEKISASQLRALVTVRRSGVTTVTALARDLGALPSSATRLCDRLVAAGYLDRTPDATNRRFHAVSLTSGGQRLLDVLDAHRRNALAAVLTRMDGEARECLLAGLAGFAAEAAAAQTHAAEADTALDPQDGEHAAPARVARRENGAQRDGTANNPSTTRAHLA
jgi:DNA-binding MarR family transcriptional regulator